MISDMINSTIKYPGFLDSSSIVSIYVTKINYLNGVYEV